MDGVHRGRVRLPHLGALLAEEPLLHAVLGELAGEDRAHHRHREAVRLDGRGSGDELATVVLPINAHLVVLAGGLGKPLGDFGGLVLLTVSPQNQGDGGAVVERELLPRGGGTGGEVADGLASLGLRDVAVVAADVEVLDLVRRRDVVRKCARVLAELVVVLLDRLVEIAEGAHLHRFLFLVILDGTQFRQLRHALQDLEGNRAALPHAPEPRPGAGRHLLLGEVAQGRATHLRSAVCLEEEAEAVHLFRLVRGVEYPRGLGQDDGLEVFILFEVGKETRLVAALGHPLLDDGLQARVCPNEIIRQDVTVIDGKPRERVAVGRATERRQGLDCVPYRVGGDFQDGAEGRALSGLRQIHLLLLLVREEEGAALRNYNLVRDDGQEELLAVARGRAVRHDAARHHAVFHGRDLERP